MAEAAEGAVELTVLEMNGDTDVRPDPRGARHVEVAHLGVGDRVLDDVGETLADNSVAVALAQGKRCALGDRAERVRVPRPDHEELALLVHVRQENDLDIEESSGRLQDRPYKARVFH